MVFAFAVIGRRNYSDDRRKRVHPCVRENLCAGTIERSSLALTLRQARRYRCQHMARYTRDSSEFKWFKSSNR